MFESQSYGERKSQREQKIFYLLIQPKLITTTGAGSHKARGQEMLLAHPRI